MCRGRSVTSISVKRVTFSILPENWIFFFNMGAGHSHLVEFGRMGGLNRTKESKDKVSAHQLCAWHCVFQQLAFLVD